MRTHAQEFKAAVQRIREVFSHLDTNPGLSLLLTEQVRLAVVVESKAPVSTNTALAGIHIARVRAGRETRSAAIYGVTQEDVRRSVEWIRNSGVQTNLDLS